MYKVITRFFFISSILLLSSMVYYKFYYEKPKGELNNGILFLIGFMVLLIIAEYLNHYSVGALVHQQIRIEDKKKIIRQQAKENKRLIKKLLVSYKSNIEIPRAIRPIAELNLATVVKSNKLYKDDLMMIHPKIQNEVDLEALKSYIISKYFEPQSKSKINLIEKVEIDLPDNTIDPIGNFNPIFDGYYENDTEEFFFTIAFSHITDAYFNNRLYVAISRLYWYQLCTNKRIILKVIFVDFANNDEDKKDMNIDAKIFSSFLPAIKSGLLHFEYLSVLDKEVYMAVNPIFKT